MKSADRRPPTSGSLSALRFLEDAAWLDATTLEVPYGTYTITVSLPEAYVLLDEYTSSVTLTVDSETTDYATRFVYHKESADGMVEVTPATCESEGLKALYCEICGVVLESEVLPATGHDYVAVVTEPTCTADGYTTYTCQNCGDVYTDSEVDALGHNYVAVVTPPTDTTAGFTTSCHLCFSDGRSSAKGSLRAAFCAV